VTSYDTRAIFAPVGQQDLILVSLTIPIGSGIPTAQLFPR
jgi:hypothetical protein